MPLLPIRSLPPDAMPCRPAYARRTSVRPYIAYQLVAASKDAAAARPARASARRDRLPIPTSLQRRARDGCRATPEAFEAQQHCAQHVARSKSHEVLLLSEAKRKRFYLIVHVYIL